MKHLKELKLNEVASTNPEDFGYEMGYGWILQISDEPSRGKGKGITEPHLFITKRNNQDDAVKMAHNMYGFASIEIKNIKPWDNLFHHCLIEK